MCNTKLAPERAGKPLKPIRLADDVEGRGKQPVTTSVAEYLQPAVLQYQAGCNGSAENVLEGHHGLQMRR